jgi:hypothetical protein
MLAKARTFSIFTSLLFAMIKYQVGCLTDWLSGGRAGEPWLALQHNYPAASLRAAHAARPLEPVLGGFE